MKHEIVHSIYSLLPRTQTVWRVTHNNSRIYYTVDETGEPTLYLSLTTMIGATVPKSEFLIKWIAETGYAESKRYMNERADYGSIMHLAYGKYIIDKKYDFSKTAEYCKEWVKFGYMWKDEWVDDINSDLAAFMQFVIDHKVEPKAVELVLVSKAGYGTLIDLVCDMTIQIDGLDEVDIYKSGARKGQPREVKIDKKITALINFKSKRTGQFYETEEIQCEFEKRLFEENYPDVKVNKVFNLSPKDWKGTTPTYALKDQTDSLNAEKADAILNIAKIELMKRSPVITQVGGEIKFGQPAIVKSYSLIERLREMHTAENLFESEEIAITN